MKKDLILLGDKTLVSIDNDIHDYGLKVERLRDLVNSRCTEEFVLNTEDTLFLDSIGVLESFNRI